MSPALRASSSQLRRRAPCARLLAGCLAAALATLATERLGLPRCFAPSAPGRQAGHAAGSASGARNRPGQVARQEAVDFKTTGVLAQDTWAHPKPRLMQALHLGGVASEDLNALVTELLATRPRRPAGAADATVAAMDGTWRLLAAERSGSSGAVVPRLALYSGGQFLHEGSVHNGGLFKAVLETQAAEVKLGEPKVKIADGRMAVSVGVEVAPGREKTLAYSAMLTPLSPGSFRRTLVSLDLPEPVGSVTPLVESDDMITAIYSDKDLLVLQDQNGHLEFLVLESVQLLGNSDLWGVSNAVLFQSAV